MAENFCLLLLRRGGLLAALFAASLALSPLRAAEDTADRAVKHALEIPLHEAIYHATVRRVPVRAGLRLEQQNGGVFLYRSWAEPRGALSFLRREVSETSLVLLDRDGVVQPISYRRRDGFGGRHSDMLFDHSNQKLTITYRDEERTIEWEPGIHDVLSLRLVLARDLALDDLKDVYRVVDDRGRVEDVDVEVMGHETLSTPLGQLDTVRLEYRNADRDRVYRVWFATGMDMALVRLEQYEAGNLRGALNLVEYRRL